jgi:hypothetical protein
MWAALVQSLRLLVKPEILEVIMSDTFTRSSKKPLVLCWICTAVAFVVGAWDGVRELYVTHATVALDPRLALATFTFVGLVWATYYTHNVYVRGKYDHLGKLWYDIKRHGIDLQTNGNFFDETWTNGYTYEKRRDSEWAKYHVYAWMCWAYAEDCHRAYLHDDASFRGTFRNSARVHRAWFDADENRAILDEDFVKWIEKKYPKPLSPASEKPER